MLYLGPQLSKGCIMFSDVAYINALPLVHYQALRHPEVSFNGRLSSTLGQMQACLPFFCLQAFGSERMLMQKQPHAFVLWGFEAFALPMQSRDVDAQRSHASTFICK